MRYVVFDDNRLGLVDGQEIVDVTDVLGVTAGGVRGPLQSALEADALPVTLADPRCSSAPRVPIGEVTLRAPLPRPGKVIGAPVNYFAHQEEMEWPTTIAQLGVFLKASTSVIGPTDQVLLPYSDVRTDQEGELAVVIGRRARDVRREHALDYVLGYSCLLDITVRSTEDRSTRKSFDTFTPIGPWVVGKDEVGDPGNLQLRCWVNDELRQDVCTSDLIFDVPLLISYASSVMTLEPGDVIATGTPAGVGPIVDGDRIVVDVERVGRLEVGVSADGACPYASRPGMHLAEGPATVS
jgi:2-keto-4-pentenoate hydratase/2-oxohepta-3-ene-1,7-dioic acid hydratase in catechol pathway